MSGRGELWPGGPIELPATVRLGNDTYLVRARPPLRLLHDLGEGRWSALVPAGLGRRDRTRIARRLYDPADGLDFPHLWSVAGALAGRLAGVALDPGHDADAAWFPAYRICGFVVTHWLSFDGWCIRRGFDPHTAPLHRIVAAGWQFMIDHRPTEGSGKDAKQVSVESLRQQVWTPPGPLRVKAMRFTASQERETALAALREQLPG